MFVSLCGSAFTANTNGLQRIDNSVDVTNSKYSRAGETPPPLLMLTVTLTAGVTPYPITSATVVASDLVVAFSPLSRPS